MSRVHDALRKAAQEKAEAAARAAAEAAQRSALANAPQGEPAAESVAASPEPVADRNEPTVEMPAVPAAAAPNAAQTEATVREASGPATPTENIPPVAPAAASVPPVTASVPPTSSYTPPTSPYTPPAAAYTPSSASRVPPPAQAVPPTSAAKTFVPPPSGSAPASPGKLSPKAAAIAKENLTAAAAANENRPAGAPAAPVYKVIPHAAADLERLESIIQNAPAVPFKPAADALIVSPAKPKDSPSEEFRSLRTRLNHLQSSQPLHMLVVTSASPAEGKSFTACNLAMSQAQLNGKRILLADFDFRRPSVANIFGFKDKPGLTDYLMGKARIDELIHRIEGTNLYVILAGESVTNPLELLNLTECRDLLEALRDHFDWVILDSPPLLFAADGNLLATMADGTVLVVRIGTTTFDSVTRALQSLCENNVLGIVVNGAHHGELYSRYSYYQSYYYGSDRKSEPPPEEAFQLEAVGSSSKQKE